MELPSLLLKMGASSFGPFLMRYKYQLAIGVGLSLALYFMNKKVFRKMKGVRKLRQRFYPDSMISTKVSVVDLILGNHRAPMGIVFPSSLEEIQTIVRYANKYGFGIKNEDVTELIVSKASEKRPYIILNQKSMNKFEYDQYSGLSLVGSGMTIEELNNRLAK